MESKTPPSDALGRWIQPQRWFGGKGREIRHIAREDWIPVAPGGIALVVLELDDGTHQRYAIPLAGGDGTTLVDALDDPRFCRTLLALIEHDGHARGERGEIVASRAPAFPAALPADVAVRRLAGEQSNTSVTFGDALILKHFRRIQEGINPEAEVTRFLTERTGFTHTPRLAGSLEYHAHGAVTTIGVLQELVPNARDGWQWMLDRLGEFYRRVPATASRPDDGMVRALAAESLAALRRLGTNTGQLHCAFASDTTDPAFTPEPSTPDDIDAWAGAVQRQIDDARRAAPAVTLEVEASGIIRGLEALRGTMKIRHHGDFHLGQTLYRADIHDFVIIDFEGEPLRPLAERRRKHAAVRDVAGMLRSINYAIVSAPGAPEHREWGEAWETLARQELVAGYRGVTGEMAFQPASAEAFAAALAVFELEKAAYEVVYEASNRPAWIAIPTRGFVRAAASLARRSEAGAA
jgi:maltose alpha-D-glucosyltransferase/alpha-amylase